MIFRATPTLCWGCLFFGARVEAGAAHGLGPVGFCVVAPRWRSSVVKEGSRRTLALYRGAWGHVCARAGGQYVIANVAKGWFCRGRLIARNCWIWGCSRSFCAHKGRHCARAGFGVRGSVVVVSFSSVWPSPRKLDCRIAVCRTAVCGTMLMKWIGEPVRDQLVMAEMEKLGSARVRFAGVKRGGSCAEGQLASRAC